MKRAIFWTIPAVAVAVVLLWVVPMFMPWSPLNCRHQEVDIMTGRLRFSRYLLFCKVSERVEASALSEALPADMVETTAPDWHRVNTFSPGVHHSPHYIFHSGIAQIRTLELLWSSLSPPPGVRRAMAEHLLALWQHSRTDSTADNYLRWFWEQYPTLEDSDERQQAVFDRLLSFNITNEEKTNGVTRFTAYYPDGTVMDQYDAYVNKDRDRVKHGVWTTWHPSTNGEQAVFKDGKLVGSWKPVTRSHNREP